MVVSMKLLLLSTVFHSVACIQPLHMKNKTFTFTEKDNDNLDEFKSWIRELQTIQDTSFLIENSNLDLLSFSSLQQGRFLSFIVKNNTKLNKIFFNQAIFMENFVVKNNNQLNLIKFGEDKTVNYQLQISEMAVDFNDGLRSIRISADNLRINNMSIVGNPLLNELQHIKYGSGSDLSFLKIRCNPALNMSEFKNKRKEGDIDSKSELSDDGECCFELLVNFDLLDKCKSYYGKLVVQDGTRGKAGNCEINEFTDDLDLGDVPANQLPACILNAKIGHTITTRLCDFDSSAFKNNKGKIIKPDNCPSNEFKTILTSTTIKIETSSVSKGTETPIPRTSTDSNNIKMTTAVANQTTSIVPENRTNTFISSISGTTKASFSVGDENQSTTIKTSSKPAGNKTTSPASQSTMSGGDSQSQTRHTDTSIVVKSTINSSTTIPIETSRDEATSEIKQTENGLQEGDQVTESPEDLTITIKETTTQFLPITEETSTSRPKNEEIEEIEVFGTNRGKNALKSEDSEEQKDMVIAIIVAVLVISALFAVVAFIIFVAWKKKKIKAEMNKKGKKVEGSKKKSKNKSSRDKPEGSKKGAK